MKSSFFSVPNIQRTSTAPKDIWTPLILSEFILINLSSFQLIIEISIFYSPSKIPTPLPHEDTHGENNFIN